MPTSNSYLSRVGIDASAQGPFMHWAFSPCQGVGVRGTRSWTMPGDSYTVTWIRAPTEVLTGIVRRSAWWRTSCHPPRRKPSSTVLIPDNSERFDLAGKTSSQVQMTCLAPADSLVVDKSVRVAHPHIFTS